MKHIEMEKPFCGWSWFTDINKCPNGVVGWHSCTELPVNHKGKHKCYCGASIKQNGKKIVGSPKPLI